MKIYEVSVRSPQLLEKLLAVWEASVRATHHFLSDGEIRRIGEYVPQALQNVQHLMIAEKESGEPIAFMGVENHRLEMLFIAPTERGKGFGRLLLQRGMQSLDIQELTVNEQNPQAVGFYKHMGFETYKRTECDEEGDAYPLLYMRRI